METFGNDVAAQHKKMWLLGLNNRLDKMDIWTLRPIVVVSEKAVKSAHVGEADCGVHMFPPVL